MEKQSLSKRDQGQSMTEFAIILIILMILLAGIVDIGRSFFAYIIIRDAVQDGAIYGAVHADDPNIQALIETRVKQVFLDPNNPSNSPIDPDSLNVESAIIGDACAGTHQDHTDEDKDGNTSEYVSNAIQVKAEFQLPVTMPFLGGLINAQQIKMSTKITNTIMTPICQ